MVMAKNLSDFIDISKTSASDYTLMISNLPSNCQDITEMRKYITFVYFWFDIG
jgi:hypothetical protein